MEIGLLLPGGRCELCGALLLFAAVKTRLGGMFCTAHQDLPSCRLCGAPFRGGGRFCDPCAATGVNTQDELHALLPKARAVLRAMGMSLKHPVRVRLVDETRMHAMSANESGMVGGFITIQGQRVMEIYVAAGLPEMEFGATVAHEFMHAWIAQNGFPRLDRAVEEGLCQVVAYRWLRDQPDSRASLVRNSIDNNPDPVYGDGFRTVKQAVKRHGMNAVLATVKATGRLP